MSKPFEISLNFIKISRATVIGISMKKDAKERKLRGLGDPNRPFEVGIQGSLKAMNTFTLAEDLSNPSEIALKALSALRLELKMAEPEELRHPRNVDVARLSLRTGVA